MYFVCYQFIIIIDIIYNKFITIIIMATFTIEALILLYSWFSLNIFNTLIIILLANCCDIYIYIYIYKYVYKHSSFCFSVMFSFWAM